MQPDDDKESPKGKNHCKFNLIKKLAILQPIAFGSHACTDMESKAQSFNYETESGR